MRMCRFDCSCRLDFQNPCCHPVALLELNLSMKLHQWPWVITGTNKSATWFDPPRPTPGVSHSYELAPDSFDSLRAKHNWVKHVSLTTSMTPGLNPILPLNRSHQLYGRRGEVLSVQMAKVSFFSWLYHIQTTDPYFSAPLPRLPIRSDRILHKCLVGTSEQRSPPDSPWTSFLPPNSIAIWLPKSAFLAASNAVPT